MVHSLFIIGLGFMLTLKPDVAAQKEVFLSSLVPALEQVLQRYIFTSLQVLLYMLALYTICRKWYRHYTNLLY
jgi:hypothetical protein